MQVNLSLHAQWARRGAKFVAIHSSHHTVAFRIDRAWCGNRFQHMRRV